LPVPAPNRPAPVEDGSQLPGPVLPLVIAWLLLATMFSLPGRGAPTSAGALDALGLAKFAVRAGGVLLLGFQALRLWQSPRRPIVVWTMTPAALFAAWALASTLWSPLPALSFGQAVGFTSLLMVAVTLGLSWRGPEDNSRILFSLSLMLLAGTLLVLGVDMVSHEASGLARSMESEESGLVHPNNAGVMASLGLVILVASRLLWGWRWSRIMLVPGALAHGALAVATTSRTSLALTAVFVPLAIVWFGRRGAGTVVLLAGLAAAGYWTLDPEGELARQALDHVMDMERHGSEDQVESLNGRADLWEAILHEYQKSPIIGHGYFVSSSTGELDVWGTPVNHSAHNLALQVLMSTGIIGTVLFVWGLWRPIGVFVRESRDRPEKQAAARFVALIGLWYLGGGILESCFMEGIQAGAIVFFVVAGFGLANLLPEDGQAMERSPPDLEPEGTCS
jgi:O-antigen ligase